MLARLKRLRISMPPDISLHELDKSFEEVTGKDCDIAAMQFKTEEFRRAIAEAIQEVRRRKSEPATVVV